MIYAFLDFELDEGLFELRYRGEPVGVQARVWSAIAYLIRQRTRVVERAELSDAIWKDTVVSDTALSQVVMLARKALRDEGSEQRVIKTVRGRGFRFVAEVQEQNGRVQASPASAPSPSPSASRPVLFGRSRELETLLARLDQAAQGRGALVLIGGEPGIGKSSLVEELAQRAGERGLSVLTGKAWEEGGAPPFWPFIQVLRALHERHGSEPLRAALGSLSVQLTALLPELGAGETPTALARGEDAKGPRARFRQFDAVARLLRHACRVSGEADGGTGLARPRLLVLEDLHAVDQASVQLLRFLAQELGEMALLVVATYRDLELNDALASLVSSSIDTVERMRLEGLSAPHVSALLEHHLGHEPARRFSSSLHTLSGGNPLLIRELLHRADSHQVEHLLEVSALSSSALPERILGAVREHLAELPEGTTGVLSAASAFGREFVVPQLAALLSQSEPAVLEALAPALSRDIVRPAPLGASRLVFSHALVRNAVYQELAPSARVELHRRIGELLERSHAGDHLPLHEIAHHYYLGSAAGARKKALSFARRAARQAEDVKAYEEAATLYDRALQLAELESAGGDTLHDLLDASGRAWYRASQLERALARFDRAAALARAESHAEHFAWATAHSSFVLRGTILYNRPRKEQMLEALGLLPPGDSAIRAMVLGASLLAERSWGSPAEREARVREAIEMARRVGDDDALKSVLNGCHLALWGAAHPSRLLSIADELVSVARKTNDEEVLLDALLWRLCDSTELGERAEDALEEYIVLAERSGSPQHRYMFLIALCSEAASSGDFVRASTLSQQAYKLGLRLQEPSAETFYAVRSLFLDLDRGASETQATATTSAGPPPEVPSDHHVFWALWWARRGRTDEGRRVLRGFVASGLERLPLDPIRRPTLAALGQLGVTLGEREAAEQVYALLRPDEGLHLVLQAGVYFGPVSYYLGVLAAALGRDIDATGHFERALFEAERLGAFTFVTRAQFAYGTLLAGRAETSEKSRALLDAAASAARELSMLDLSAEIEASN